MITTIFVKLMDEGTLCYRPVGAIKLTDEFYKILDQPTEDEKWEFQPNDIVKCVETTLKDGQYLIAVEKNSDEF